MIHKTLAIVFLHLMAATYIQGMLETQARAMPIQMDMSSDGDVTICTGLKRYIACRDGSNIAVTNAFWGRISDKICPSDDGDPVTDCEGSDETLPLVKKYCESKNECKLEAKHSLLQNNGTHHCPGVNKYLIVNYTCIPESKGVTLCDSAETTLSCNAGWVMELADIFWGRRSSSKYCGTEEGMECDSSEYASRFLKNQCNGKRKCLVKADSSVLDNSHSQCNGMLKYLMVNYICKPNKNAAEDYKGEDKEKDDDDDNKLLQDSSSKELMGLLEKHLNEIKTPDAKETAKVEEKKVDVKQFNTAGKASAKGSVKQAKTRTTLGRGPSPFVATEEDEITNTLLNTPSFTRSLKTKETSSLGSKLTHKSENAQRKDEVESPAADIKSSKTSRTEQEVAGKGSNTAKDTVPKGAEESFEVSEPNTVRSILQRAKEVLKTLDSDAPSEEEINKRAGIARTDKKNQVIDSNFDKQTAKAVKQVANLAQSLAATRSIKGSKQKKSTIASVQKPKAAILRPNYRGGAGFGNTP